MTNQELCTLYESLAALIESDNADKALQILKNAIRRIDKGETSDNHEDKNDK